MNQIQQNDINIKGKGSNLFNKFFRIFSIKESCDLNPTEDQELIENIKNAKKEWINANTNFDYVDDQELVDYYTYKIKACQIRYEYYLKKAKERGVRLESMDTVETIYNRGNIGF